MGSLCSSNKHAESMLRPSLSVEIPQSNIIKQEKDIVISPRSFVKKNQAAFFSIYRLDNFPLGSGARGEVRICTHIASKDKRVVKIISKSTLPESLLGSESLSAEVNIMKELDHPNLPRIYEFFEDTEKFYIVLEFCKGGDLFDKIVELHLFEESKAAEIMSQIFSGLNYLHSRGIVHRDIKPENVLLDKKDSLKLKIIDFDTATFFGREKFHEMYGTPMYMAPEVVKGKYNEKCDIWSCGIIMYILLCGGPPFDGTDDAIFKILKNVNIKLEGERWNKISIEAKDLLSKLLVANPEKRITASEACKHKWIIEHAIKIPREDITRVLDGIKTFKKTTKLKEAIHTFIISKLVDPNIFATESKVFDFLDENKDGGISRDELVDVLKNDNVHTEEAEMYADLIMEHVDSDKNGKIDYTEFLRATVKRSKIFTKENLQQAFNLFDQDGNGTIELEELKKCLSEGSEITVEVLEDIMNQADRNGDGKIDIGEFEALLLENLSKQSSLETP
ncbi:hypothetical protein SteCoe_18109 [Stentor coeruleus]|uniref:non-specific serine/threonine protein kinase n=1 Tax=Stentor coeruleus TaxID=5963 RepID=A0A1R2BX99_9CILI|nr:hypothetical protein SteCoe_18109 [Stentor coeruleus]